MKTIILIRHGKSSWEFDVPDRYRALTERGQTDAATVAVNFMMHFNTVDKVVSSPANRAFSTCKIFTNILNINLQFVEIIEELYDFEGECIISYLKSLNNDVNSVMIFGHNHAFTSISNIFGSVFIENLPTSGLVKINFNTHSWSAIKRGVTELIMSPNLLRR